MSTTITGLRIPTPLLQRYNTLAQQTKRPRSFYMNEALEDSIEQLEYEYGILQKVEDFRAGKLATMSLDELEDSLDLQD